MVSDAKARAMARKINAAALDDAYASQGYGGNVYNFYGHKKHNFMIWILAIIVGVLVYFLLKKMQPDFVLTWRYGLRVFSEMKAIVTAVLAGLAVLLVYYLFKKC